MDVRRGATLGPELEYSFDVATIVHVLVIARESDDVRAAPTRRIARVEPMLIVHVAAAIALLAVAALAGVWGVARARSIGDGDSPREGRAFAQVLQMSHTLVVLVGILGVVLLLQGGSPDDPLHARVYGPFMLVAIIAAYGYRTEDAARNVRVFAVSALVILALGLRAFVTGA